MNAFSIYLTACRYVIEADENDESTWTEIYRYLPYLRQALLCCVCRNLIRDPMGPTHKVCQHFVCRHCVGGKMKLKPQCGWCKDHNEFKENSQLRITVLCFKKLCQYISDSKIGTALRSSAVNGETNNLVVILDEANQFVDSFPMSSPIRLPKNIPNLQTFPKKHKHGFRNFKNKSLKLRKISVKEEDLPSTSSKGSTEKKLDSQKTKSSEDSMHEENKSDLTTDLHQDLDDLESEIIVDVVDSESPKSGEKKNASIELQNLEKSKLLSSSPERQKSHAVLSPQSTGSKSSKGDNCHINSEPPVKKPKLSNEHRDVKICKCGRGGTNSRLTCLGQRCPCYIKRLPCIGCKCKGCRNPRKSVNPEQEMKVAKSENTTPDISLNNENIMVAV